MTSSRSFVVSGRVQGVGFRYSTRRMAERLELSGWVENLPNGDVKVIARGDPARLEELEAWLWSGPDAACVSEVAVAPAEPAEPVTPDNPDPGSFFILA